MPSPLDICYCGDYRRDHKNGVGACTFNEPGRFDLCHGGEDCLKFRLHQNAEETTDGQRGACMPSPAPTN